MVHDGSGQLRPLSEHERRVLDEIRRLRKPVFSFVRYNRFQENLVRGIPNDWQCHAGSRYLYICENGLVHWCSQQRGYPGIPLEKYSPADLEREYDTVKSCAPLCTINCVHQTAHPGRAARTPARDHSGIAFGSGRSAAAFRIAHLRPIA